MNKSEKMENAVPWVACISIIAAAILLIVLLLLSLAGLIHPRKKTIYLFTPDLAQVYDETAITVSTPELRGQKLHDGHTISVTARFKYTNVGTYRNAPEYVILDETGADVTNLYAIFEEFGTIEITARKIKLTTPGNYKVYDGEPLPPTSVRLASGTLVEGHELITGEGNEMILPGEEVAAPLYQVLNSSGKDVTDQYEVIENFGLLTIAPIVLTLTTESSQKQYDGKPLSSEKWKHTAGHLLEGHRLEMTMTTTLTHVGAIENQGTARVIDAEGKDVTHLYEIRYQFGILTVNAIPLYITTGSKKKEYDGEPLQYENWKLTGGKLAPGQTIHLRSATECKSVGTVDNKMEFSITDADGVDVTAYYAFNLKCGTLTIQPRSITLRTGSAQKVYDGTPLSCEKYTITSGKLCQGDSISLSYTSITEAGYSENYVLQYSIYRETENQEKHEVTDCYRISFDFGTLKITAN